MSLTQQIEQKLINAFDPHHIEVENESHNHSGNRTDSHFRLVIVSDEFNDTRLLARHRKVNALMADELANGIHALALHTFTLKEWQDKGQVATRSPVCASKLK